MLLVLTVSTAAFAGFSTGESPPGDEVTISVVDFVTPNVLFADQPFTTVSTVTDKANYEYSFTFDVDHPVIVLNYIDPGDVITSTYSLNNYIKNLSIDSDLAFNHWSIPDIHLVNNPNYLKYHGTDVTRC